MTITRDYSLFKKFTELTLNDTTEPVPANESSAGRIRYEEDLFDKIIKAIADLEKLQPPRVYATDNAVIEDIDHTALVKAVVSTLQIGKPESDRLIVLLSLSKALTITCTTGEQFQFQAQTSNDSKLLIDQPFSSISIWGDGTTWNVITNPTGSSQPTVASVVAKVVLAALPANTWTDFPAVTGEHAGKAIVDYKVKSSTGLDLTDGFEYRTIAGQLQIMSLTPQTDLQFDFEL